MIYFAVQCNKNVPGVVWKISYEKFPELKEIHEKFILSCQIPTIPKEYFQDLKSSEIVQQMRKEASELNRNTDEKYIEYETKSKYSLSWTVPTMEFYSDRYAIQGITVPDPLPMFKQVPKEKSEEQCHEKNKKHDYIPRLGCYMKTIDKELETFASTKIQELMTRLRLPNQLERLTDSRGSTYMPQGGFMEKHSNQKHFAGWRLYIHYLPNQGESFFGYQHPYDHSFRKIQDTNSEANLFRIRKLPQKLLWHSIWSDSAERFSWGLFLPSELAQFLKQYGTRF